MITEIVTFKIPGIMDREAVVSLYNKSVPSWEANPHLIHKSFLYDPERNIGGGVYLWESLEAARESHGEAFHNRIRQVFGSTPEFAYFETPLVIDNRAKQAA